ncbi:MAG: DUF3247 family protein [Pseudoxanthomonas sp.]
MTKIVERVHTDQAEIALIEARIARLDDESIVELTLSDGSKLKGVVTVRPTVQTFRDADGTEGINSLLRLEDLDQPGKTHQVWLDQVTDIFHMGSD